MTLALTTVRRLAAKAMQDGHPARYRRASAIRHEWDVSSGCETPINVELFSRWWRDRPTPSKRRTAVAKFLGEIERLYGDEYTIKRGKLPRRGERYGEPEKQPMPTWVLLSVPCRRCATCRRKKAAMWNVRATSESQAAIRTWFGTLTFSPEYHQRALARARQRMSRQGLDYDTQTDDQKFSGLWRELSKLVTLYIKRLRKGDASRKMAPAQFRYLLVAEAHKTGLPHAHMLVHETCAEYPAREAALSRQWIHGFSKWRLVGEDDKAVAYVCKYVAKSAAARVRASARYGGPGHHTP